MNNDILDGFAVNVFLDEDGDYLAHFVELPNISAFSDTPEGALKELTIAWQGVKKSYQKRNDPISKAAPRKNKQLYLLWDRLRPSRPNRIILDMEKQGGIYARYSPGRDRDQASAIEVQIRPQP